MAILCMSACCVLAEGAGGQGEPVSLDRSLQLVGYVAYVLAGVPPLWWVGLRGVPY